MFIFTYLLNHPVNRCEDSIRTMFTFFLFFFFVLNKLTFKHIQMNLLWMVLKETLMVFLTGANFSCPRAHSFLLVILEVNLCLFFTSGYVCYDVSPSEENILEEYFITANRRQVQGCSFFYPKKTLRGAPWRLGD